MKFRLLILFLGLFTSCGGSEESLYKALEEGEQFPGGAATVDDFSMNAFGHAAPNLLDGRDMEFVTGNAFFKRNWVSSPSSTEDLDGLGPLFNARSCSSCHEFDGKGAPPSITGEEPVALLFRLSVPGTPEVEWEPLPEPNYGEQFNHLAIMGVKPEGKVEVVYKELPGTYADGTTYSLREPDYQFKELNYGPFSEGTMISPRIASHLVGLGLLEAIEEKDLLALQDVEDADNDGISGKINYVWDKVKNKESVGRFGWKANEPSVRQQVAAAFRGDIGITSSLFTEQPCSGNQQDCIDFYIEEGAELKESILDRVTVYSQTLAVPARREFNKEEILIGKQLFAEVGCADCHTPSFVTGAHPGLPEFSEQKIFPYTDLLLHDMGPELADNRPDGKATGHEWRTPPLWGIGLSKTVNGHTFLLHDGRARNVEEAILWHGGEAKASSQYFKNLSENQRQQLIAFVNSL